MTARRRPFLLSATVDFPDDLEIGAYTPDLLDQAMRLLREAGVRRVNWLSYGSSDPDRTSTPRSSTRRRFGPATIAAPRRPAGRCRARRPCHTAWSCTRS